MKNVIIYTLAMAAIVAFLNACQESTSKESAVTPSSLEDSVSFKQQQVLRGGYLVSVGGCSDCHTPKIFTAEGMQFDTTRLLSGHPNGAPLPEVDMRALQPGYWVLFNDHLTAAVGPWGLTFSRNLTPHGTGIKGWKEEIFIKALRTGKHMGMEQGRPIMPPMPWFNVATATDEDLKAIYAYLQSLKPIDNHVPEPMSPEEVMKMTSAKAL
ncbi:mono/diheme cytochrome c family protein [Catalinimonas alkaloidigena]|uniref:c-type cytochrome n=1 Tax=Catalinimonas alkaloidigena TaxID=1075417 RepID=UPI002405C6CB|nr:c-type cytochrome [Catalinimonas alkaloidigena]MDF9796488.1 mono/diheme cytochrome c family protein [Catalinimonas alkaloidigena]